MYCSIRCAAFAQWMSSISSAVVLQLKKAGLLPWLNGSVPCVDCGSPAKHYDHRDYAHPDCVDPVCVPLPKEMLHGCDREKLEQMGIKFGADVDDLFVTVQLPEGWKKKATDHAMWSDLLDDNGRKRAAIFYKAAFYDRRAHISLCRRYGVSGYEPCDNEGNAAEHGKNSHMKTVVKDGDAALHVVGIREDSDYKTGEAHGKEAGDWLTAHFPNWQNPLAYWE